MTVVSNKLDSRHILHVKIELLFIVNLKKPGAYPGGALGAAAPRGHLRAPKKRKRKGREEREKKIEEKKGGNKKEKR